MPFTASRRYHLAVIAVLLGGFLTPIGTAGALSPLLTRDASPCVHNIAPPVDFSMTYHEGITSGEAVVSLFPFGVQCTFVATSTGETAESFVPLWPTIAVLGGFAAILVGAAVLVLGYRNAR